MAYYVKRSSQRAVICQRILVPLNGSTLVEAVLPHAREIAARTAAEINGVHVPLNLLYAPVAIAPPLAFRYEDVWAETRTYPYTIEQLPLLLIQSRRAKQP
jgi:nucleotide-binding universal stress UspA family protein